MNEDELRRACVQHGEAMFQRCFGILRDRKDAEDATNEAILKALNHPPDHIEVDIRSWLCSIATNTSLDVLRKQNVRARKPFTTPAEDAIEDQFREFQIRSDTNRLLGQISEFLDESERNDLQLYLEVVQKGITEEELAKRLGIAREDLKKKRRRVREKVRDAAVAVCLIADPGERAERCVIPRALAERKGVSPRLLREIRVHFRRCETCGGKRADTRSLLGRFLAIPGVGHTTGLLDSFTRPAKQQPVLAASVVIVAFVLGFVLLGIGPSPERTPQLVAPPGTSESPVGRTGATPPAPPTHRPPPAPPEATPRPPVPPAPSPQPKPATTRPTTSKPGGGARENSRPSISRSWIEHRWLAIKDRNRCDGRPTTSGVAVTVTAPDEVESVTVRVTTRGGVVDEVPMAKVDDTSIWHGEIGPFATEHAGGKLEVSVVVVAANGTTSSDRIGTVCVTSCHGYRGGGHGTWQ